MASKKGSSNASPVQEKQKPTEQAEKATENVQMESEQIPVPEISVRIDKLFDDDTKKLKAFASANIGPFAVHGIRIFENEKGMFVNLDDSIIAQTAIEKAEQIIRLSSPDLKSISFYLSQLPCMSDSKYRLDEHIQAPDQRSHRSFHR